MDRRNFIRLSVAGLATGIVAPQTVLATSSKLPVTGNIFYTKDAPGRWSKKVGGHFPMVELDKGVIQVSTNHDMNDYNHYIVKHIILDKDYNFLDENMFNPMKDKRAVSEFKLSNYSGPVYALSVCNKHDTWMNVINVINV